MDDLGVIGADDRAWPSTTAGGPTATTTSTMLCATPTT